MKIAIASGKGGTGKTTVATNLATIATKDKRKVTYLDCDVEEPNGHIFLKPCIKARYPVYHSVPVVNQRRCIGCGKCGEICQYSAILLIAEKVLTYSELCHGCGGCKIVCPTDAIIEEAYEIGKIEKGYTNKINFVHGILNIGEVLGPRIIKAVKKAASEDGILIIDAPPGTSCPVVESIKGADYVVLVTEPTPFGLNDLKLAVDMVRLLDLEFGVVINRAGNGFDQVNQYCFKEAIEILAEIPDDQSVAEAYSKGEMVITSLPQYQLVFEQLWDRIDRGKKAWKN